MKNNDIIDFQEKFTKDFIAWSNKHPELAEDEQALLDAAVKAQIKWYAAKKNWLNGISPNEYFYNINDAKTYVSLLIKYIENDIYIPDPLIECLTEGDDETYNLFINILDTDSSADIEDDNLNELKARIIELITEMRRDHPYSRYISILLSINEPGRLLEAVSCALEEAPNQKYIKELLLNAYPVSEGFSRMAVLDILTALPDDDMKTADLVLAELTRLNGDIELGVLSCYEATLKDERALSLLKEYISADGIDYFTYSQLRYAIEAITGEELPEKDFSGDSDYDKIANLKEDEIFG